MNSGSASAGLPELRSMNGGAPRILIITPNWIGDAVAAQPLVARLKTLYPSASIDALAPAWVAPAMQAMSEIREVTHNPFGHGTLALKARYQFAQQFRDRYDAAWVLPNSLKSALIPWMAGIPLRVGFRGEFRYGLLNRVHQLNKQATPLQVQRYAILAEAPGTSLPAPIDNPKLVVSEAAVHAVQQKLQQQGIVNATVRPVIFCPGAEYGEAKRWPVEHYATLATQLAQQQIPVWLLGSSKDHPTGEAIRHLSPGVHNLCGNTSLSEAIAILSFARFVITNDSGLMHVSAALDTPLVALFGSSSPGYTPPLSIHAQVVSLGLSCSPCFKRSCPLTGDEHLRCLRDISPEHVLALAKQFAEPLPL